MFSLSSMCFRDSEDCCPCFSIHYQVLHEQLMLKVWSLWWKLTWSPTSPLPTWAQLHTVNLHDLRSGHECASPVPFTMQLWEGPSAHRSESTWSLLKGSICGPRSKPAALVGVHPSLPSCGVYVYMVGKEIHHLHSSPENRWKKKHFPVPDVPHSIHPNYSGHIS